MKISMRMGAVLLLSGATLNAADKPAATPPAPASPPALAAPEAKVYAAGQFTVSPFTGWNLSDVKPLHGRQFTGLGVGYHLTDAIAVEGELAASDTDERAIDQWGVHLTAYLPVWKSGLALFGQLGYQQFTDRDDINLMSTGAGVALRGKRVGAKIGGRWLQNFQRVGNGQVFLALEARF